MKARRSLPSSLTAILISVLVTGLAPVLLDAQDFSSNEPSARAAALGGAFMARADDATALFYNPAGLAFLGSFRIKTNIMFGRRSVTAASSDADPDRFRSAPSEFIGDAALSWQPIKRVTIAAGVFSPFNYETAWLSGRDGLAIGGHNLLRTTVIRTAVAVEPVKSLALALGLDLVSSTARWQPVDYGTIIDSLANDFEIYDYGLHGHGTSFVAGALWKIVPAVQVGAKYQERLPIDCRATSFADRPVMGRLTLPRQITAGVALTPWDPLSFFLDLERARWSEFESSISTLDGVEIALQDTTAVKAGVEYRTGPYTALRAGYAHRQGSLDKTGLTPVYPDLDLDSYSLGFGYEGPLFSIHNKVRQVSELSFDVFLRYTAGGPVASAGPGQALTYRASRLQLGFGVGFIF